MKSAGSKRKQIKNSLTNLSYNSWKRKGWQKKKVGSAGEKPRNKFCKGAGVGISYKEKWTDYKREQ